MDAKESAPKGGDERGFGPGRDLKRLKVNASASLAELREFIAQTRGRSPQEVLGMVAGSQLTRCIGWAAVGTLVVLIVFTIGPYLYNGPPAGARRTAKPAATARPTAAPAPAAPAQTPKGEPAQAAAPATGGPAAQPKPAPADTEKAVKIMGLGDTKEADPKKNPMEKSLDNLLDKVE